MIPSWRLDMAGKETSKGLRETFIRFFLTCAAILAFENVVPAESIVYPKDAGLYNVRDYGGMPDDGQDDREGILAAMEAAGGGKNHTVYFPNGIYNLSGQIKIAPVNRDTSDKCGFCHKRTILQGQSTAGTILLLDNNCEGFQDPKSPKGVVWMGTKPAQRFRNAVRNLTIHTGSGNPGASGLQFNCSNQGTVRHVRIVSGDGQGFAGLDLVYTNEIGPGYVEDLEVEGFDYAVQNGAFNMLTFEFVKFENQNKAGMFVRRGTTTAIRKLESSNTVAVIENEGVVTLLEADLSGGSKEAAAIENKGVLYARDITARGYGKTIINTKGHQQGVADSHVGEFTSEPVKTLFPSARRSLHLPIESAPDIAWGDPDEWVNVVEFGALGDGKTDCTKAIQTAIDQPGAKTVYLPAVDGANAQYKISGPIYIRGSVERLIGCEARIAGKGILHFVDGEAPAVIIERLSGQYNEVDLEHRASRTLIVSSCTRLDIRSYGSGKLFIEDLVADLQFLNPQQKIWIRQINTERKEHTNILNAGATLWVMGLKTEKEQIKIHTHNGGKTELLGAWIYAQQDRKPLTAIFRVEDSVASFAGVRMHGFEEPYTKLVAEKRDGTERVWNWDAKPFSGRSWALFTAYKNSN